MKYLTIIALVALIIAPARADDDKTADAAATAEAADRDNKTSAYPDETGAERNARKDAELARAAQIYNEEVESDLDKVICKKVQVTGSRRKVRVCQTAREIEAEKASTKEFMRRLKRSGQTAAQTTGL